MSLFTSNLFTALNEFPCDDRSFVTSVVVQSGTDWFQGRELVTQTDGPIYFKLMDDVIGVSYVDTRLVSGPAGEVERTTLSYDLDP